MRKIHLTLILIATLSNVLPSDSPFRALLALVVDDPNGVVANADPDVDPIMINTPPPR
jgi:hypothetical protein